MSDELLTTALDAAYEALEALLESERAALIHRDLAAIEQISSAKREHCGQLALLQRQYNQTPSLVRDVDHDRLQHKAAKCLELNAVNGKIIQRTRQSVDELLQVLRGSETEPLYAANGSTQASSNGSAFARA